jgi:hypothetical protein
MLSNTARSCASLMHNEHLRYWWLLVLTHEQPQRLRAE